jgi:ubiquinone/menaquinone biosynthesis C-methylase UbiE
VTEAHKARVQAQFGGSAEAYVRSPGHAAGADLDRLVAWGRARGARAVLDIATGGGHTAAAFAAFTPLVVSTDLTAAMVRAARGLAASRGLGGVRFAAADVDALPFKDASFGVVTCRIAAHHFPALLLPLRQIARVLAPAGRSWSRTSSATRMTKPPPSSWRWKSAAIRRTYAPSHGGSGKRSCAPLA